LRRCWRGCWKKFKKLFANDTGWRQNKIMSRRANSGRKRSPSAHQKQIRFFTGLFLFIIIVATTLIFWFLNRTGFTAH
jgi:hypothetical protein